VRKKIEKKSTVNRVAFNPYPVFFYLNGLSASKIDPSSVGQNTDSNRFRIARMENGDPMVSLPFSYPFDLTATIYYIIRNTSPSWPARG
jgi:hypothetical protein